MRCLATATADTISAPDFKQTLQAVKGHLYEKQYAEAFGQESYRRAYEARWVPSRAIVYRRILREFAEELKRALFDDESNFNATAVMIGGGAGSEFCALTSVLERMPAEAWRDPAPHGDGGRRRKLTVAVVDSADWSTTLTSQHAGLLSAFPSLEGRLAVEFRKEDILSPPSTSEPVPAVITTPLDSVLSSARLVTILFTISELFLQSRPATLSLLSRLSRTCSRGCLLLIVESASLSSIPIGKEGRVYALAPMLDLALAQDKGRGDGQRAQWESVETLEEDEGKWYRLPQDVGAVYGGVKLENTRVVMRLYRKL